MYEKPAGGRTGWPARRLSRAASIQPTSTSWPTMGMIRIRPVSRTFDTHCGSRDGQAMLSDSSVTRELYRCSGVETKHTVRSGRALPEQVPADHHALDLVGALVDLRDLGVSHHALHRVLLDVAVASEHLHGLDRDRHRGVGAEDLGHRGVLAFLRVVLVGHRARLVEQLARGCRAQLHVRELELDPLELVDRLPELAALLRVLDRVVRRALGDP